MARKKTQWDKNYERVLRARDKAITELNRLSALGYHTADAIIKLLAQPLHKRYTKAQAEDYTKRISLQRIRRSIISSTGSRIKPKRGREARGSITIDKYQLNYSIQPGENETQAIIRTIMSNANIMFDKNRGGHPSRSLARDLASFKAHLSRELKPWLSKSTRDYLRSINTREMVKFYNPPSDIYNDIMQAAGKADKTTASDIRDYAANYVATGRSNLSDVPTWILSLKAQQWAIFAANYINVSTKISKNQDQILIILNDLFSAPAWQDFRSKSRWYQDDDGPVRDPGSLSRPMQQLVRYISSEIDAGRDFDTDLFTNALLKVGYGANYTFQDITTEYENLYNQYNINKD